MAEQEERYYKISLLNKWFAISSIIFVLTLLWMFQDDYARKWKEYQREFRQLEVDKTKDAYLDAEAKLLSQAEYAETMYALVEAERTLDDKYKKVEELKTQIAEKEADSFRYTSEYQRRKSLYDEIKYLYEEAIAHHGEHHNTKQLKAEMQDKEKKMNELVPKMQSTNQNLKDLRDELKPYEAEKKRLEKFQKTPGFRPGAGEILAFLFDFRKVGPRGPPDQNDGTNGAHQPGWAQGSPQGKSQQKTGKSQKARKTARITIEDPEECFSGEGLPIEDSADTGPKALD